MIKVKKLKKKFGDIEVLKDINIQINEKEVVVVIGPLVLGSQLSYAV